MTRVQKSPTWRTKARALQREMATLTAYADQEHQNRVAAEVECQALHNALAVFRVGGDSSAEREPSTPQETT